MAQEIRYVGGSLDGKHKCVRSIGEQRSTQTFVWKEYRNGKATGKAHREVYKLNRDTREYVLQGDI